MKSSFRQLAFAFSLSLISAGVIAAPFTPGNLVVVRVGNGSATPLGTSAAHVFLDEYTTAGTLVQSIPMPTTSGSPRPIVADGKQSIERLKDDSSMFMVLGLAEALPNRRLTLGGLNTAEGFLNLSTNGRYLTLGGYDAATGTANVAGTAASATNRVIGLIDWNGAVNTTTAITDGFSTNRIASVATDDGTRFWSAGAGTGGGLRYSNALGAATSSLIAGTPANLRVAGIYGGQLYTSASFLSPNYLGVAKIGTGLPTTTGQTTTMLPGFPTSGTHSHFSYFFKDANTLFVTDDGTTANGGGLQKWTLSGGTWTQAGTPFPYAASAGTPGLRGLTGIVMGSTVVLYATTAEATGNKLVKWTSTNGGASGSFTTLATAPTVTSSTVFRGVAFAPTAPPTPTPTPTPTPSPTPTPTPTLTPTATPSPTPGTSAHSGLGANVYPGGTAFRVWAPNASAVSVVGTFNSWNSTANPMFSEGGNGRWSVDVPGVVAGAQYKYAITYNGVTTQKADPRARQMTNSVGNSIVVDPTFTWSSYTKPGFNEMVIYEMHVGTFNDTAGGTPGNWASAQAKLPHLAALGVNMIEVLPVSEFAGDFSWGYNPAHLYAPESIYGSPNSMRTFVNEAHKVGIGVIVDVVHNHYGPSDLALWKFDGPDLGNGGIYFYTDFRKATQWGDTRPDYGRGEVRSFIRDNSFYWFDEFNCDGLRWDSTCNIRNTSNGVGTDIPDGWSLLQWVNNDVNSLNPTKIIIAEDLQNNDYLTKTTSAGGAGFDSQWDAQFVHPVRDALIVASDASRDMNSVRNAITHLYNGQDSQRVIYTESHDEVANGKSRVPEEIWPGNAGSWASRKRSTLGAVLVMTSPGIPMIFEGQEFLESGFFADNDPIDWSKDTTYAGIKKLYKDLITLRKNAGNTTKGLTGNNTNVYHVNNSSGKVIGMRRWYNGGTGDDVIVIMNFENHTYPSYNIGFPSTGTWQIRFNSDSTQYSSDYTNVGGASVTANTGTKDGLPANANVALGPYSAIILSK